MSQKQRLPITPAILRQLRQHWEARSGDHDTIMLWAACCLGFFGFLCCAEFTCPSMQRYDAGAHLSLQDFAVDSHSNPTTIRISIKQSKTDPFRKGVDIFLGRTNQALCPVAAMLAYVAIRGQGPGPLFLHRDGSPLSRVYLVQALHSALAQCGINPAQYNSHSSSSIRPTRSNHQDAREVAKLGLCPVHSHSEIPAGSHLPVPGYSLGHSGP